MGELLRFSHAEAVLRSVGDTPGIVGLSSQGGTHVFIIDPGWAHDPEIQRAAERAGEEIVVLDVEREPCDAPALDVEDAVMACEGLLELQALMAFSASAIQASLGVYGGQGRFEVVRDACDFAIAVRDAAQQRIGELEAGRGGHHG